jgi:hypothetical protein
MYPFFCNLRAPLRKLQNKPRTIHYVLVQNGSKSREHESKRLMVIDLGSVYISHHQGYNCEMDVEMLKKVYVKSRKVAKVRFELPKSELPSGVKIREVHLVGDFNDWNTGATPMARNSRGVYTVQLELEPGREYQFRYLANGEHWFNEHHADAYVPGGSGEDNCVLKTPPSPTG